MDKKRLVKYAKLIAGVGANVQKEERVVITADLDMPEFVKMTAEQCYKLGASDVKVEWNYQPLTQIHVKYQNDEELSRFEKWEVSKLEQRAESLPVMIYLVSEDPDGLANVDQAKYSKSLQEKSKIAKPIRDSMENKYKWTIAAVPGEKWARKVFPNYNTKTAVKKLWEAILYTSRVTDNPEQEWKKHNNELKKQCEKLNNMKIRKLHYKASNGTDLTVGLIEQAIFAGGGEYTINGEFFNANIPTEEVFTTPKKGEAQGIVYATRPLSYRGQLIEDFSLEFKDGKVVNINAQKNAELIEEIISMDEGAAYLGECAFVPYDSPIQNSGLLFYNTLIDENASCHIALGMGYSACIKDYENYTLEQCRELGVNNSSVHVDFMIGCEDLSITAILENGEEAEIFKDGNFCI